MTQWPSKLDGDLDRRVVAVSRPWHEISRQRGSAGEGGFQYLAIDDNFSLFQRVVQGRFFRLSCSLRLLGAGIRGVRLAVQPSWDLGVRKRRRLAAKA